MKARLIKLRRKMAESFWFIPMVMVLLAVSAALSLVAADRSIGSKWLENHGWLWSGGPDGARTMMATIAGSLITVISIVFSLTITTLAQTATHFGPRVLRNFTSDTGVQITLGTFVSTFVYCLLVMRTVRSVEELSFVPYLAVNLGFLMTLASVAVLVYFIDHISKSIQADNLIAEVGRNFLESLPELFPRQVGDAHDPPNECPPRALDWQGAAVIHSAEAGYLQHIDAEALIQVAGKHDLVIKLIRRPGDFLTAGMPVMEFLPSDGSGGHDGSGGAVEEELRGAMVMGGHRTAQQDGMYPVQQLVEIAARALSPGINDPFTAITCLDWLGACLSGAALSDEPVPWRHDENHRLRVIANPLTFEQLTRVAFDQIRISGGANPEIMARLFEIIAGLAKLVRRSNDREALIRQTRIIAGEIGRIGNEVDRDRVTELQGRALQALTEAQPLKP
jgi:uncharacterized membrane protein